MSNPLHAEFYADCAVQVAAPIVENVRLATDTYRVRFDAPQIARRITPGQFVMLRLAGLADPLIGRPLALYDTVHSSSGEPEAVDVVYLVKGKLTSRLHHLQAGQRLDVWGPLGNGFGGSGTEGVSVVQGSGEAQESGVRSQGSGVKSSSVLSTQYSVPSTGSLAATTHHSPLTTHPSATRPPVPTQHLIMVAGGIGQTPFLALAQEALHRKSYGDPPRAAPRALHVTFCYGARSADYFAGLEDFEKLGIDVRLATDDGSRGHHGLVTDVLKQVLAEHHGRPRIVCCGPEPMMEAVAKIAHAAKVPCQVSLETPMACGIGICFTCVAKVKQPDGSWDYKRTCVEGPVFDAERIEW